ncbi:glycoside hydrolase family 32 protein [Kineococcus sp. R8]|uniref:GH32 C-terminal domain-containing protein n=1 Tax=Kineococcus siccus TaxID=2696567 RepID=UPI001411E02F|nr:GH32 C-terminal domain-containing protein [Kineococcus siccus]NAZ82387.1 glycoside hydrolase family 32 protein [Kineococcus siccus]
MRARRLLVCGVLAAVTTATAGCPAPPREAPPVRDEALRPQVHYTPAANWMNDPNGLVYHQGEYHLFYQYNPLGDQWGNMSWGHAVSTDLVHWEELPVAIPFTDQEHVFSGSVVVDVAGTSGFGTPEEPAMVAVYTSLDTATGRQAQSLAYSTDRGRTFTKFPGNPVLDVGSKEFRDPKVFWYAPGGYWVMAVTLSTERKVQFYRSADLRSWEHLSDFGPANAVDGVWEMPDLFELPVDGDPARKRWVLVVNLNPGSVAGGSGAQYFVGDFDGRRFTTEDAVASDGLPPGRVLADFEGGTYGGWTPSNDPAHVPGPFGTRPFPGTVPGQHAVTGYRGSALVNSILGGDAARGRLTSPAFTVEDDHLNLLVGGGRHPHVPGTAAWDHVPEGDVLFDFELPDGTTYEDAGWTATGSLRGRAPVVGPDRSERGHVGTKLLTTFYDADAATGTLTSPEFRLERRHLSMLLGGGANPRGSERGATVVELLVGGEVVRTATAADSGYLNWTGWDVEDLQGRTAQLRVVDESTAGWGHLLLDHVVATDAPVPARSTATAVNLVVDGRVVRSATGSDSERLDWASWDVRDLRGREARLEVEDSHGGRWGHVLLDHVVASPVPALPRLQRYRWLDHGADYYAAGSFEGVPGGRRVLAAWMDNWDYAAAAPATGSRGAMALPREVVLETVDGRPTLVQRPVRELERLATGREPLSVASRRVSEGVVDLPEAAGDVLEIRAEFDLGTARRFGLRVREGSGGWTAVGYDADRQEVFLDRRRSGQVSFSSTFPAQHSAPLTAEDGRVSLVVHVDRSSVEVYGGDGRAVITDKIFPLAGSDGVALFAEGGDVTLRSLQVSPLRSIWR